jgi:hypothetical protein
MLEKRPVRLIRKSQRQPLIEVSGGARPAKPSQPSEREIKTVVTNWVREHRQRSEEFRLTFAALLKGGGFQLP